MALLFFFIPFAFASEDEKLNNIAQKIHNLARRNYLGDGNDMKYDNSLLGRARTLADSQHVWGKFNHIEINGCGQNIGMMRSGTKYMALSSAILLWIAELDGKPAPKSFALPESHATQVLWKSSTKFACVVHQKQFGLVSACVCTFYYLT